jgi:hypothetical protein
MRLRLNGGEYTVLVGDDGQESKFMGYPTVERARTVAAQLLDSKMATRVVIARPSGLVDTPDFWEVHVPPATLDT